MFENLAPFTIGLLGSLHCIGMCGPLLLACSLHFRPAAAVAGHRGVAGLSGVLHHHIAFHVGRLTSYGLLGAIVAGLFESLEVQKFSMQYRGGFTLLAGILLLAIGLSILGVLPIPSRIAGLAAPGYLGKRMAVLAGSPGMASKVGLGVAAGFIPCGLTWAMLVTAASTLHPAKGFATMVSFGLGTVPLLLATGVSASFLSRKIRLMGERAAAIAVIIMGIFLMIKGGGILYGIIDHCAA
ncbi:MAG: sulfite exporter TauE/SafE family protein [Syntrophobacter sp.]